MVPAILEIMIQSPLLKNVNLSFLKTVGCGGSGMSEEFEKKAKSFLTAHDVKAILGCGYGMTENCSVATVRMNANTEKIGSAGVPLRETVVGVFEPNSTTELPYNTEGEICIQSKSHMVGYYNEPELTKAVLIKHNDEKIWLHTGDIGIIDEDGFIFIKNRIQRYIFTYPSDKVYPNELEETIGKIEGVDKIAVIPEPDLEHSGYKVPAGYIVCKVGHSQELVKKRVISFCKDNLSQHSRPRHIYFIDEMPLTPIGKIDIAKLEKEAEKENRNV